MLHFLCNPPAVIQQDNSSYIWYCSKATLLKLQRFRFLVETAGLSWTTVQKALVLFSVWPLFKSYLLCQSFLCSVMSWGIHLGNTWKTSYRSEGFCRKSRIKHGILNIECRRNTCLLWLHPFPNCTCNVYCMQFSHRKFPIIGHFFSAKYHLNAI